MPITIETYTLPRYWEQEQLDTWIKENNLPAPCNVETHPDFLDLLIYSFAIATKHTISYTHKF